MPGPRRRRPPRPYEILSALGIGAAGEVYRARDRKLHRDVAIKVLRPSVADDPDGLMRFAREAQILASLNHPNIAHVYGFQDSTGVGALVMELVEVAGTGEGETCRRPSRRDAHHRRLSRVVTGWIEHCV